MCKGEELPGKIRSLNGVAKIHQKKSKKTKKKFQKFSRKIEKNLKSFHKYFHYHNSRVAKIHRKKSKMPISTFYRVQVNSNIFENFGKNLQKSFENFKSPSKILGKLVKKLENFSKIFFTTTTIDWSKLKEKSREKSFKKVKIFLEILKFFQKSIFHHPNRLECRVLVPLSPSVKALCKIEKFSPLSHRCEFGICMSNCAMMSY